LKGSGFDVLWPEITALTGIAILLLTISVLRFHKSLE
jgi:ABC-2 type transport system permease protein